MRTEAEQRSHVLVRCDGTSATGLGHVSRCLALAEALDEAGYDSVFCGRFDAFASSHIRQCDCVPEIVPSPHAPDCPEDLEVVGAMLRVKGCAGVVIDSYAATENYLDGLSLSGKPVIVIDDFRALPRYPCSAIVNFTVGAATSGYPPGRYRGFFGPQFLLARRALRQARTMTTVRSGPVQQLLIAIGGTDRHGIATRIVRALLRPGVNTRVRVIVGSVYPDTDDLQHALDNLGNGSHMVPHVPHLARELLNADACICGGGLTKYECAFLGVPAAVVSQTLEQGRETQAFVRYGTAANWGVFDSNKNYEQLADRFLRNSPRREAMSRAGLKLVPADPTRDLAVELRSLLANETASIRS